MNDLQAFFPVAMRMGPLWPENIRGFEKHRKREGVGTGHVDRSRSGQNKRLIGHERWAEFVDGEIQRIRLANLDLELAKLRKRRRSAEILANPEDINSQFVDVLFRELLENVSAANPKTIVAHPLRPAELHQPVL